MRRAGITIASVFGAGVVAAVIGVVVVVVIAVHSLTGAAKSVSAEPACPEVASRTVGGIVVPAGPVAGFCQDRLVNLDHGDAVGPDSRGLFQQRDNGAWGTYEQRMDPYTAATMFYTKLVKTPGWKSMTPTQMAHAVQINADPDHYAKFWPEAKAVVEGLTGQTVPDAAPQG